MLNREGMIAAFVREYPPAREWRENLLEHLPKSGKVKEEIPLIRIRSIDLDSDREILVLKACEVCQDEVCAKFCFTPPDGIWATWGDLVLILSERLLAERIAETMAARGLCDIPTTWCVEFNWPSKPELVGNFR